MIYVSKTKLGQVEYLLNQSLQGNHVLFDPELVRESLACASEPLSDDEAYSVEPHIERMLLEPSLEQKKAYLEALDRATQRALIRTYFAILETNLYETLEAKH